MSRLNLITATALAAVVLSANANAADMPVYYEPEPMFGGWYLRGDIGISNQGVDEIHNSFYDSGTVLDVDIHDKDFEASWFIGAGVGYQFNEWLRTDLTVEYRAKSDFDGLDWIDTTAGGSPNVINDFDTDKSEWTFLANVYWDITTWHSITPFVGFGLGGTYNKIHDLTDLNLLDPGGGPSCPVSNGCADSNGEWQFAWALHAGLAFAVAPNIAIEIAYRYLNLGDAESGDIIGSDGTNDIVNPLEFDDIDSHDVKIGLRYTFQ